MALNNSYTVAFRRKREGKTDYRKRLRMLSGRVPRLVVRKSLKHFSVQIIDYKRDGDVVLASAHSSELVKLGWKGSTSNTSAAYLTGLLLASKAKNIGDCALDLGQYVSVSGSVLYAVAKGVIDGGLKLACSDKILPAISRIRGEHVAKFAKELKSDKKSFERMFSAYIKKGLDPENLPKHFDEIKSKIGGR